MKLLATAAGLVLLAVFLAAAGLAAQLLHDPAAQAPAELRATADEAAALTGTEPSLLLAIAYRQTTFGQARAGEPDALVPADIRVSVNLAALAPGGPTATLLQLDGGRRLGDWAAAGPQPGNPGVGFLEIPVAVWRAQAPHTPGGPRDPYRPLDAMLVAGHYLGQLMSSGLDLRGALTRLAGAEFAEAVLRLLAGAGGAGQPMACPGYTMSQDFGPVELSLEPPLFGYPHFHSGWDLVCPAGTPVVSVTAGLVSVQMDPGGFGLSLVVSSGDLFVRYAHLAQATVSGGQAVFAGQEIGREGSSGNSTGPHLHFEVDRGCPLPRCSVNPATLIGYPTEGHGH